MNVVLMCVLRVRLASGYRSTNEDNKNSRICRYDRQNLMRSHITTPESNDDGEDQSAARSCNKTTDLAWLKSHDDLSRRHNQHKVFWG